MQRDSWAPLMLVARTDRAQPRKEYINVFVADSWRTIIVVHAADPGHWEGDLIFGTGQQRAIGTLVERVSRYT